MKAGTTVHMLIGRSDVAGAPVTGKVLGDFAVAIHHDGTAISPTVTCTERATQGRWRCYDLSFQAPATVGLLSARVDVASGTDAISGGIFMDNLTIRDEDSIYGLMSSYSVVNIGGLTNSTSRTIHDGDVLGFDLVVPETALQAIGAPSLAASTLTCQAKLKSLNSDDPADATLTTSIVTDTSGARLVRGTFGSFPAAFAVADNSQANAARIDLRLTYSGKTIIGSGVDLTIVWKATTA